MTCRLDWPISAHGSVSKGALRDERLGLVSGDSFEGGCGFATVPTIPMAGERIHPGMVGEQVFREHEARYVFASRFVQGKRVLDVACGTGIGTQCLLNAGAQSCVGLDIDQLAVAYARAAYGNCV